MDTNNNHPIQPQQEPVYSVLAEFQQTQDWDGRAAATILHKWTKRFNEEFKLQLPEIILRVEVLPVSQLGHFRGDHNGLGLRHEVAINILYLNERRPRWEPFATLAHQLIHAWQFSRGIIRPTHVHDAEYRRKATEIGLVITNKGLTGCIPGGRFLTLLAANQIVVEPEIILPSELPDDKETVLKEIVPTEGRLKGVSKLRKYSCGCTTLRVAHKSFRALCLLCGNEFASNMAESSGISETTDDS